MSWQQHQDDILSCTECLMGIVSPSAQLYSTLLSPTQPFAALLCWALLSPAQSCFTPDQQHITKTSERSALCNQGHWCFNFYPSQGLVGRNDLPHCSLEYCVTAVAPGFILGFDNYMTKEMRLKFVSSGLGTGPSEGASTEWLQFQEQSDTTLFPLLGTVLWRDKNKNWFELLCRPYFPHLFQQSQISTVVFVWHFQKNERNEAFFWGRFFIIKTSIYLVAWKLRIPIIE